MNKKGKIIWSFDKKKYYYILILYYLYYDIMLFVLLIKIIKICIGEKSGRKKIKSNEKNKNFFKKKFIINDKGTLIEKVYKIRIRMN